MYSFRLALLICFISHYLGVFFYEATILLPFKRFYPFGVFFCEAIRKNAEEKLLLACLIKEHYSLSNERISALLHMDHPSLSGRCRSLVEESSELVGKYQKISKRLMNEETT